MNYSIDFDKTLEVVHVSYTGSVSLLERVQAVNDVCTSYSSYMPLKIVVDVRNLTMNLTFDEQKDFGVYLSCHIGLKDARVAVIHTPNYNPNVIIDACAFHNGYKIAEFNNLEDAQSWITAS